MLLLAAALLALPVGQDPTELHARLVDHEGNALAGAQLQVFELRDHRAVSDGEGRVRLGLRHPKEEVTLLANAEGFAPRTWRLHRGTSSELDLGQLVLSPASTLTGRVVTGDGERVGGAWQVEVTSEVSPTAVPGLVELPSILTGEVDPDAGEFRIPGVPAGTVRLQARLPDLGLQTQPQKLVVEPGSEPFVELPFYGSDPARTVLVVLRLSGHIPRRFDPVELTVVDRDGQTTTAPLGIPNSRNRFNVTPFAELGPGPYRIEHADPRFAPLAIEDVAGGTRVEVDLESSLELRWNLTDASTGEPIPAAALYLIDRDRPIEVHPLGPVTQDQLLTGLYPSRRSTFEVHVPGRPPLRVQGPRLDPGGTTTWNLEVSPPRTLELELVDDSGAPLSGVQVHLTQGLAAGVPSAGWYTGLHPSTLGAPRASDDSGKVQFQGLYAQPYTARIHFGPALFLDRRFHLGEGSRWRVAEPAWGWLELTSSVVPEPLRSAMAEGRLQAMIQPSTNGGAPIEPIPLEGMPTRLRVRPGLAGVKLHLSAGTTRSHLRAGTEWTVTRVEVKRGASVTADLGLDRCQGFFTTSPQISGFRPNGVIRVETELVGVLRGQEEEVTIELHPSLHASAFLEPGEYTLMMCDRDRTWGFSETFVIEPGGDVLLEPKCHVLLRFLEVVDAESGDPIGDQDLHVRTTRDGFWWDQPCRTDANGDLIIALLEGEHELHVEGYRPTTFQAVDGAPSVLRVRRDR